MNVWCGGTYDLLHPGHVHLFREAHRIAMTEGAPWTGRVIVAVNTDEFVETYKGTRPVQSYAERLDMVSAVRWVNETQRNDGTGQADLILAADARVILIGDDWAPPRDYLAQLGIDQTFLDRYRIRVVYLPRRGGYSSTLLKALIRA